MFRSIATERTSPDLEAMHARAGGRREPDRTPTPGPAATPVGLDPATDSRSAGYACQIEVEARRVTAPGADPDASPSAAGTGFEPIGGQQPAVFVEQPWRAVDEHESRGADFGGHGCPDDRRSR